MIDSYLWGDVSRISPEAPVPVVECKKREHRLGGAANVALNVKSLGANPILCAVTGNDDKAAIVSDLMIQNQLDTSGIIADPERITTIKFRVIASGQHIVRVDEENTHNLSPQAEKCFIENIKHIAKEKHINAVIFEDYDKGTITPRVISEITEFCISKNIPTLTDPKKRNFTNYRKITLYKPNFKELTEGMKIDIRKTDFPGIFELCKKFIEQTGHQFILTTLSELGMMICSRDFYHHIPAEKRDISDVSGAGDTVVAVASVCLAGGLDAKLLTQISNLAGGLVCEKVGVVPVDLAVLKKEVFSKLVENQ
jgi:rfaE bifunctional protein kinase chain/domain